MNGTIEPQKLGRLARKRQRIRAWTQRWTAHLAPRDQEQERESMTPTKKALVATAAMAAIVLWALLLTWMM